MPQSDRSVGTTADVLNHLKSLRTRRGLTQSELASRAGITRQAVSSIESNLYLPTTGVALQLASALNCRVEDLFSLTPTEEILEGTLVGHLPHRESPAQQVRVKVSTVGRRTIVRPAMDLGEQFCFAVPADGYVTGAPGISSGTVVRVKLSRNHEAIQHDIAVAGCDPAIFLAGEHLRRQKDRSTVVGWTMGSMAALQALQRREVHVAGLHLYDPATGESNLPFLKRSLKGSGYEVITFAAWEEGFLVRSGNPLSIRTAEDLTQPTLTLINREKGSGARLLLDRQLRTAGIPSTHIRGYDKTVASHFDVARAIAGHQADVGIGVRSAARHFGLDFVPLQIAR
ncbi:MAG: helix-turn-helix domain-containing protein, partial [Nitrospira sp.]|nr:helix-turn-helix domain-containing protein [Nitrospira sp.]